MCFLRKVGEAQCHVIQRREGRRSRGSRRDSMTAGVDFEGGGGRKCRWLGDYSMSCRVEAQWRGAMRHRIPRASSSVSSHLWLLSWLVSTLRSRVSQARGEVPHRSQWMVGEQWLVGRASPELGGRSRSSQTVLPRASVGPLAFANCNYNRTPS